jgi:threonylcarbamoyladenosine tRNA methylthiotransferase MtaB
MVERLKAARPEIAIGADLIAGFPTEDAAMAANSAALIDDCDIVFGHVFPFSPRAGTPAARMPQLDRATIRRRAADLRARAEARRARWLGTLVGTRQAVLAERGGGGHAPNFARVRFEGTAPAPGAIADIIITGVDDDALTGRVADETA